jgi:dihydroorotate dehydrogenase (NAD+) catalytic subunit
MTDKISLKIKLKGRIFKNPLILSSGILGTRAELLARVAKAGAGGVTTKSCGLKPREGHENPTVLAWEHGLINAVGISNPGVEEEIKEIGKLRKLISPEIKIIASFFGETVEEFVKVAKILSLAQPEFLERNISCPNTESELGLPIAYFPEETYKLTRLVKKRINIPLIVKLSPNVSNIKKIAKAAEEGGADAISAINTLTGMVIDIDAAKPILNNKFGGVSGPAIKPIAVRCIYEIFQTVKIPIIGIGGVTFGKDALEMIMAGASLVGIGSAIFYRGINVFKKIEKEIKDFMESNNYKTLTSLKGIAHES